MASYSIVDDRILVQVRKKVAGVVVFSQSKKFPLDERKAAEGWAERLEKDLDKKGVDGVTAARISLGELIRRHGEYIAKDKPGGILGRSLEQNYDYMAQQMDKVRLDSYRAKDLIDFASRRRAEGVSPATILSNLSPVSSAINAASWAHHLKIDKTEFELAMNVLRDRGLVAKSREVIRIIDQEEDEALMRDFRRSNMQPQTQINMERCFRLGLYLPRRASELTRIEWSDINPKRRTLTIRDVKHPRKKMGNDQVVPLVQEAWDLLEEIPKLDARILPYVTDSMLTAFERAVDRVAESELPTIADVRFHDVRHTGITMLFWRGLQIPEVALISGHTNWTQLKRYTHIRPEDVHRKMGWQAPTKRAEEPRAAAPEPIAAPSSGRPLGGWSD